ncbi:MAG: hypothetical protein RL521_1006 [Bacteroidota bacterium]|jgi:hypothetical protein
MKNLAEVRRYIDSFSRPDGYNHYAWDVTKRLAMEVWESYLENKRCNRSLNYLCKEFYQMIQEPSSGEFIIPKSRFRMPN